MTGYEKDETANAHFFLITVKMPSEDEPDAEEEWVVRKRFSTFEGLRKALVEQEGPSIKSYSFPRKTVKTPGTQTVFGKEIKLGSRDNKIDQRGEVLREWLVQICAHHPNAASLHTFLEVGQDHTAMEALEGAEQAGGKMEQMTKHVKGKAQVAKAAIGPRAQAARAAIGSKVEQLQKKDSGGSDGGVSATSSAANDSGANSEPAAGDLSCPACGVVQESGYKFCAACGAKATDTVAAPAAPAGAGSADFTGPPSCLTCGLMQAEGYKFCTGCGAKASVVEHQAPEPAAAAAVPLLTPEEQEAADVKADEDQAARARAEKEDAFRRELAPLKLSELKKLARAEDSISDECVDGVDDEDSPKEAAVELLVKVAAVGWAEEEKAEVIAAKAARAVAKAEAARLEAEAEAERIRIEAEEAEAARVKAEEDAEAARLQVAEQAIARRRAEKEAALRAKLGLLRLRELKKRMKEDGMDEEGLDAVDDSDDPIAAAVDMIVASAAEWWELEAQEAEPNLDTGDGFP